MDRIKKFPKKYSDGCSKYKTNKYLACTYDHETTDIEVFINNNKTKFGKYIMVCHHVFSYGHNVFHCVYNIETNEFRNMIKKDILKQAFIKSPFNWIIPKIGQMYNNMYSRCYNKNDSHYFSYGGRGIKIEEEWYNPNEDIVFGNWFQRINFRNWVLLNGFAEDQSLQIDRFMNDGNYCIENCQLVSEEYNDKFKSKSRIIHINFANLIHIYDVETCWDNFIFGKDSKEKIIRKINKNHRDSLGLTYSEYNDFINYSVNDKIRLYQTVQFILNNLPEDFIKYRNFVLKSNNIDEHNFPIYWDREKPWYNIEWLTSYRIS